MLYNNNNEIIIILSFIIRNAKDVPNSILFPVQETGSRKALYFIYNDTPKLSSSDILINCKKTKNMLQLSFFMQYWEDPTKFEMFIIIITIIIKNKRAMMALGRSPEYHWNQIISKSVLRFSRRSCLKLFSIYSPGGHFVQQSRTV